MEKNTKLLIGVAAIGGAAYLYWRSTQPAAAKDAVMAAPDTAAAAAAPATASMVGANGSGLKGLKMKKKLVGFSAADNLVAKGSKFNAGGAAAMPQKTFYNTQSSAWVR